MAKTYTVTIETYLGHHKRGKKTVVLNEHLFPLNIPKLGPTLMQKEHPEEYERICEYARKKWGTR